MKMKKPLVPASFKVQQRLETKRFLLRMLTIHDVDKDYDAVMSSIDNLKGVFGPYSSWPSKDLTKEQDLIDLGWHQKEFQNRASFAYTVMKPDESRCLGCIYIYPSDKPGYDAVVFLWVRKSELKTGLDEELFKIVKDWLREKWPFRRVVFPGRELSWNKWKAL